MFPSLLIIIVWVPISDHNFVAFKLITVEYLFSAQILLIVCYVCVNCYKMWVTYLFNGRILNFDNIYEL